ncbi:hypothetical protein [Nioella nitratireducens]|uniref:hypothetical protein n=1 Tax=Nioella nitratireducens TaxID=1287720 RepID=UPI0008FD0F4B|nr:hypothetical protein [Nioella nitratireducens]
MEHNFEEEIAARERKGRFLEAERLRERGPVDAWKSTRGGPLREGIITVNKLWFGGTGHEHWDPDRVEAFKQRATEFLLEHFPDGQLREVNIDEDEEALHIHFAVAVWVEKVSQNRGTQWLLQPSANPLLANYEYAQDLAGEAFVDLGIHRGERRAEAARQALAAGVEMPEPPRHVPPSDWRREQRRLALADRDRIREASRAEAEATVADGVALAKSVVKKSRKRAIAEAKARKAEADRQAAVAQRDRARADAQAEVARRAKLEAEEARKEAERKVEAAREEAARIAKAAGDRADVIIADATALATVTVRKSRKRAIADARARRAKADRAVAVAERARADVEALAEVARDAAEEDRIRAEVAATAAAEQTRIEEARATGLAREIEELTVDAVAMARVVADRKAEAARLKAEAEEQARARDAAGAKCIKAEQAKKSAAEKARKEEARAAKTRDRVGVLTDGLGALVKEIDKGTLARDPDGRIRANEPDRLEAACLEILPAIELGVRIVCGAKSVHRDARVVRDATMRERKALKTDQAALRQGQEQLAEDQKQLERNQNAVEAQVTRAQWMLNRLETLLSRFVRWLKLSSMPKFIRDEGLELLGETAETIADLKEDGLEM